MNSKSMIGIWQKGFQKQIGSFRIMTDKMKNCCYNWKLNDWLWEVRPETKGKLQEKLNTGKQWIDSKIASKMNWTIDEYHNQFQTLKMDKKQIILILNEIREKLDKVCVRANYGKVAGNGAQILGSGTAISGAVMSYYELPSGPNVTIVGNLVHHGGIFIDNTSKVIEACLSKKYLKEVQAILKEDKEISKSVKKWLEYMKELNVNAKTIVGVNQNEIKNIVLKLCREICKLAPSGIIIYEALNVIKEGKYAAYIGNDIQIGILLVILMKLYDILRDSPLVADKIRGIIPVSSIKPENLNVLIQILISICNLMEIYILSDYDAAVPNAELEVDHESDPETKPVVDFQNDPVTDLEADPVTDLEADLVNDLETAFVKDLEAESVTDLEADLLNDLETDYVKDLEVDSEVEAKNDPEAQPEITATNTNKLHLSAMSIAYSFKSLMDAASNIKRGESQYSNVLKRMVKTLEHKQELMKKTKL